MRSTPVGVAVVALLLALMVPGSPPPVCVLGEAAAREAVEPALVAPAVKDTDGRSAAAPLPAGPIVDPSQVYTYDRLTRDLAALKQAYPRWLDYRSLGRTDFGREIWAVRLGHGPATVLISAAHHGSEWLTATLAMAMLDDYAAAAAFGRTMDGDPAADLLNRVTFWVVPMVNPDGVTLAQLGPDAFPPETRADLLRLNGGSTDFSRWKANARGIDLNRQYPAGWEELPPYPAGPAPADYKGTRPLAAPEVQALVALTREVDPEIAVAYHSAGQVIYWHYHTPPEHVDRDHTLALKLAALTGYSLVPPQENPAGGGYKDWFIQEFSRPGFTIEIGPYRAGTPLTPADFPAEWERNRLVGALLAREAYALHFWPSFSVAGNYSLWAIVTVWVRHMKGDRPVQLIETLLAHLRDYYVLPETAARMEAHIRSHLHEYAAIADGTALSCRLTEDLQAVANDKGLAVSYSAEPLPPQPAPAAPALPTPEQRAERELASVLDNGSFHKVERLPGNIGYLELTGFTPPEVAGETAAAAMAFLSGTEALIVDVRANRGGAPGMVAMLCSYFVRWQTHLTNFAFRDSTTQFWTLPHVPGKRYLDKPVYVLTSRQTFSAAEEFCYDLQTLKRATIVGEPTSGAAHLGRRFQLDDHFAAHIPGVRVFHPATGTNWEGTGVLPDIAVPAEEALKAAHVDALRQVIARAEKESLAPWRRLQEEAQKTLTELTQ